ncbi:hypothetical protein [Bacillus paralicheniformis]
MSKNVQYLEMKVIPKQGGILMKKLIFGSVFAVTLLGLSFQVAEIPVGI